MQIEKLSDSQLQVQIKSLAAKEREALTDILKHLLEIDRRKLFSKLGYPSHFEYARVELGDASARASSQTG